MIFLTIAWMLIGGVVGIFVYLIYKHKEDKPKNPYKEYDFSSRTLAEMYNFEQLYKLEMSLFNSVGVKSYVGRYCYLKDGDQHISKENSPFAYTLILKLREARAIIKMREATL